MSEITPDSLLSVDEARRRYRQAIHAMAKQRANQTWLASYDADSASEKAGQATRDAMADLARAIRESASQR